MGGTQYHLAKPALNAHTQAAPYAIHDKACFGLVLVLPSAMLLYGDPGSRKSQHRHDIRTATDLCEPSFVKPAGQPAGLHEAALLIKVFLGYFPHLHISTLEHGVLQMTPQKASPHDQPLAPTGTTTIT